MSEAKGLSRDALLMLLRVVGVGVAITVLYAVLPLRSDRWWLGALIGLVAIGSVVPFTVRRAANVGSSDRPLLAAGEAISLLVALTVYGFAAVYLAIDRRDGQFEGLDTRLDAIYFTVTTLSTVGFGDIHATGQAARLAVTLQIVFDLTLLAVSVRLLSTVAQRRRTNAGAVS